MNASQIITPAGVARIASGGKWKPARHLLHLNRYLWYVMAGREKRVVFNLPPRHGKTEFTAKYNPLCYLGTFPERNVIYCSATHDLASEKGLAARTVFQEYGPSLFGLGVRQSRSAADDWEVVDSRGRPTGGGMRCAGVGTAIHGRGADLIILDDLIGSVQDAISPAHRNSVHRWYTGSVQTRLTPDGAVISIGTPFHSDDWFGRAQKAEEQGGDKWTRIKLPALARGDDPLGRQRGEALWPEQWPAERLLAIQQNMKANGTYQDWVAQYELTPASGDGVSEWPEDYFLDLSYDLPHTGEYIERILAIDTSKGASETGDWQAFTFVQLDARGHYWIECFMCRKDDAGLYAQTMELIKHWRPDMTVVETNNTGYVLFEKLAGSVIDGQYVKVIGRNHGYKNDSKYQRIKGLTAYLAKGLLHIARSPGGRLLLEQLRIYPHGDHDDGPDALEMALEYIVFRRMDRANPQRQALGNRYQLPKRVA